MDARNSARDVQCMIHDLLYSTHLARKDFKKIVTMFISEIGVLSTATSEHRIARNVASLRADVVETLLAYPIIITKMFDSVVVLKQSGLIINLFEMEDHYGDNAMSTKDTYIGGALRK